MNQVLRSLLAGLILVGSLAFSGPASADSDECGSSIAAVYNILMQKNPNSDHSWLNTFIGNWLNNGEKITIKKNGQIVLKGYALQFCPVGGKVLGVLANGNYIGELTIRSGNLIEVATNTFHGTVYLEREGSSKASR